MTNTTPVKPGDVPSPSFANLCHNCVFAEWGADATGTPLQTGCAHRRLDKYVVAEKVEWRPLSVPDGLERYAEKRVAAVIPNRMCNLNRRRPWGEGQELSELLTLSRREARPRWKGVVVARGDDPALIEQSLESLAAQAVPPKSVVVLLIRPSESEEAAAFAAASALFPGVRHTVSSLYGAADWRDAMVEEFLRDPPSRTSDYAYQLTLLAGDRVAEDYVSELDRAVNEDLEDICLVGGDDRSAPPTWVNIVHFFRGGAEAASPVEVSGG